MPMLFLLLLVPGDVEPPKVGQPLNFSGAVGSFQVKLRVEPEKVLVEEPVKLTLQVLARGPAQRPPRRPDLSQQRGFAERFHIGRTASDEPDRTLPDGKGWEFDYELRPRSTEVDQVPDLVFTFYHPQNGYQTRLADAVPLTVEPKPQPVEAIAADPRLFELATGDQVLQRWHVGLPPWPVLVALAVLPPVMCAAWYGLWAWRNPNAARQVRQRRSRAGRLALEALRHADAQTAPAIVTDYLRQRFDLPGAAPTPAEVAAHLRRVELAEPLADKTAAFFRAADAARYAPRENGDELPGLAVSLINALEAEPETGGDRWASLRSTHPTAVSALLLFLIAWPPDWSWLPFMTRPSLEERLLLATIAHGPFDHLAFELGRHSNPQSLQRLYSQRAIGYDQLRQRGANSPFLYRNQGNAFMIAGDLPNAILAYRRGLRLDPSDRELQWLLAHARSKVPQGRPGFGRPPTDERPARLPRLATWPGVMAVFGLYAVGCLLWTRWFMTRRGAWRLGGTLSLAAAGLLAAAVGWDAWQLARDREPPLVVVAEDGVFLRRGNTQDYAAVVDAPLGRGVEARLRFARGDWVQVELAGGEIGWLPRTSVIVDNED